MAKRRKLKPETVVRKQRVALRNVLSMLDFIEEQATVDSDGNWVISRKLINETRKIANWKAY